ncbi:MAG: hypothetical protein JOZ83_03515 [Silvibacterium sp.]|nr:hypothetical protein [Silvibacterium sp.]
MQRGAQRRRFGYRRQFILSRKRGVLSDINRTYRPHPEGALTVREPDAWSGALVLPDGSADAATSKRASPGPWLKI